MGSGEMSNAEFEQLREQTEQRRLDLLRTDLNLCHTLVVLVESELAIHNHEHAVQTLALANKGHDDIRRLFEQRSRWDDESTAEIAEKLNELRRSLDRLQPLV
jgi:hypothetical protein